jgi:non-heme chloroperoxidase
MAMVQQQPEADTVPTPEVFDTFEEVVGNGMKQYPLTPEAELRHANYHNLYRAADGKWHWRWDPMLLHRRRLNRSLQMDLYTYLRRITCPTLLVRGANSPLLTPEVATKMIQTLPQGRLVTIAAAAHTVNADNASEFNKITAAFVQD